MIKQDLTVQLRDGSVLQVNDCEFDLLLHILYKNDFDRKKVNEEIEWICAQNDDPAVKTALLLQSLRQLSAELSNKILARSISESVNHRKIVEDMLLDVDRIQYSLAENVADMRKVLHLRKKIFVDEEGYPTTAVTNGFEKESLHVMATMRAELVGCVSIAFDSPTGLPLEKFISLTEHKKSKNVEIDKLAVIGAKRKRELSFQLMWLCYSIARFWGAERMFIFTLSKKQDNIAIYSRFGFKPIGEFTLFGSVSATAMMLDFSNVDTYEKQLTTTALLKLGKKLLNKFSISRLK